MANIAQLPRAQGEFVPPLEHGDALSIEEFERRWQLHPEIKKPRSAEEVPDVEAWDVAGMEAAIVSLL
jgi:hypothetical protein